MPEDTQRFRLDHSKIGIRVIGLVTGGSTAFDGKWLKEYDPTRPGTDPNGRRMTAHIVCTDHPAEALAFDSETKARDTWTTPSGRIRGDGRPDRPLTAFHVVIERLPQVSP